MLDAIVKIIVGLFALTGVGLTGWLGWKQFDIRRNDEKEEKNVRLQINNAVNDLRAEIMAELNRVSMARSEEGAERFKTHAESIEGINRQIAANSAQIGQLGESVNRLVSKMELFTDNVSVLSESNCNSNYDRLLMVTNKILKSGVMTISDKTNLRQLYKSWKALGGKDDEMDTKYEECLKISPTLEE